MSAVNKQICDVVGNLQRILSAVYSNDRYSQNYKDEVARAVDELMVEFENKVNTSLASLN